MIRSTVLVLAFGLIGSAAAAQDVPIRSGWQEGFTRLVLQIPEGRSWRLGRSDGGYSLELDGDTIAYQTAGVFDRIPRERLSDLTATGNRLDLGLACDCHADAFLWQADRLVIDLVDGPPPDAESAFEQAFDPPADSDPTPAADTDTDLRPAVVLPLLAELELTSVSPLLPDPFAARAEEAEVIGDAERALIESIARAASQGLIQTSADLPGTEPPAEAEELPEPLLSEVSDGHPGVATRTIIDRDLIGADLMVAIDGLQAVTCLPEAHVALDTWGDERSFHVQVSEARRSLVTEFDRIAEEDILKLARLYLFFGFGAEARKVLELDGQSTRERDVLTELTYLVDGDSASRSLFQDQVSCPEGIAMWSLVTRGSIPEHPEIDRNGILLYYQRLPAPVQAQVGGQLAESFLAAGDDDAAAILLGRAQRAPGGDSEQNKLAEAELAAHYGDTDQTLQGLIDKVRTDGRTGPDMLLRIFELAAETGVLVPEDLVALSSALRFEFRGQPIVEDLAREEMRAYLARGDLDLALATVEDERTRLPDESLVELLSEFMIAVAFDAEDVDFLERTLSHLPRPLSPVAENAVANRLLDLGLAAAARDVMQTTPHHEAARERRYLRAEVALQLGEFGRVADLLTGLTDDRSNDLRLAALTESGAYESAFGLASTDDDPGSAWRAGAWEELQAVDDAEISAASRLVLDQPLAATGDAAFDDAQEAGPDGPLSRSRALLQQSEEARGVLDGLLQRFSVEDDTP